MANRVSAHQLAIAAEQNIKERQYWLNKLSPDLVRSNFPYDCKNKDGSRFTMRQEKFTIPPDLFSMLMNLSKGSDVRLHIILVTGLFILLNKYSGNDDIAIGSPILKQEIDDEYINTILVFRNGVNDETTFKELLLQVKDVIIAANKNQNYPIEKLLERLNIPVNANEFPLFDVVLVLENLYDKRFIQHIPYNMGFSFSRTGQALQGEVEYNAAAYRESTIKQIIRHYMHVLDQVLADLDQPLSQIRLLTAGEKKQVLFDFNQVYPAAPYPADKTLSRLFAEQANQTPDHIVLSGIPRQTANGQRTFLTYNQLHQRVNRLAEILKNKGVGPDIIVGLAEQFSLDMMTGILAILTAGGAYLPIDPDYPRDRINYMLADSQARALLASPVTAAKIKAGAGESVPDIIDIPARLTSPDSTSTGRDRSSYRPSSPGTAAYIIYTSGTTGKPKGVVVEHKNVMAYLQAFYQEFAITPADTVIQLASYSFDVFVEEIFPLLLKGGKILIPAPFEIMDIDALARLIVKHQVSIIDCTPLLLSEFNKLNSPDRPGNPFKNLRILISGGDVLKKEYVDNLLNIAKVYNTYGPTESTVCATYYQLPPPQAVNPAETGITFNIPIGKPIANYKVYILANNHQPVPIGIDGEICVTGPGVTRGYLNQPELTAEKFLHMSHMAHMSAKSAKSYFYKTGDLGRWLWDGNIEFLGRKDHQVKIRGYRIETGEIETRLMKLKQYPLKEAIVIAKEDNDSKEKYLCAYIVVREKFELSGLRNSLADELPGYMIPSFFVPIDEIPLTANGKIDKKALPEPVINTGIRYVEPQTQTQRQMQKLWQKVIGIEPIGIHDNFFNIGGHSLKGIQLINEIHKEFNVKVPLAEIFKTPTIKELCLYIKQAGEEKFLSIPALEKKEYYPLSSAQKRLYVLQQLDPGSTGYNMPMMIPLERGTPIDKEKLESVVKKLMERHEGLRTTFLAINEEPAQKVRQMLDIPFTIDIYQVEASREKETITNYARPFDLSRFPLFRAAYLEIATGERIILLDIHHILTDGTSIEILQKELFALYAGAELAPLRIQYKDYAHWQQNSQDIKKQLQTQEQYWLKEFSGEISLLNLPTDYPRTNEMHFKGEMITFTIHRELTGALRELARQSNVTLTMLLMSVFKLLLAKFSGQKEIIIGTVIAGRRHADLENIIGFFVNMLAIKTAPLENQRFSTFLLQVKEKTVNAYENQDYQFEELVSKLPIPREPGRHPLVDTVFVFHEAGESEPIPETLDNAGEDRPGNQNIRPDSVSHFDLMLHVTDMVDSLLLSLEFSTDLFKESTVTELANFYTDILKQVVENPGMKLEEIRMDLNLVTANSHIIHEEKEDWGL